jgi:hypothetical protein
MGLGLAICKMILERHNSSYIRGTHVPVEEPSTAPITDSCNQPMCDLTPQSLAPLR